ncbi:MAG: isopenicillin N synthase family oxygenase [Chlamydiia bacterium]|nr:isopenicillin N synthase family oxygenase [Chlamydiia bacterium]
MFRIFASLLLLTSSLSLAELPEILDLDVITYQELSEGDAQALETLTRALHDKGIVGIRGVPEYEERYSAFIKASRDFHALPEDVKELYSAGREAADDCLGYESGKERFQLPSGDWVVDDLKTSYYAQVPNIPENKWPVEVDLEGPFQALGQLMAQTGELIMYQIGLLGEETGIHLEEGACLGRMLYYRKSENSQNPHWCGAHFDHGLFTAILPAVYFVDGHEVAEPAEAGLFVRRHAGAPYKKVSANDPSVMMFQVGEFGQVISNDGIRATEHRVHKAEGAIERYTLALFFNAPFDTPIYSTSELTSDTRYGAKTGEASTYRHWNKASYERYLLKQDL